MCTLPEAIVSTFEKIDWESRDTEETFYSCAVSVDGTDFRIQEPIPFDAKWFSHKFNGPGLDTK